MTLLEEILFTEDSELETDLQNSTGNAEENGNYLSPKDLLETLLKKFNPQIIAKGNSTLILTNNFNSTIGKPKKLNLKSSNTSLLFVFSACGGIRTNNSMPILTAYFPVLA